MKPLLTQGTWTIYRSLTCWDEIIYKCSNNEGLQGVCANIANIERLQGVCAYDTVTSEDYMPF